jgi:cytoskeletal protein RodZ
VFEIGNSLREARLRREIEFAEAEYGTKIRGKYLRALEDERFELLPSHTYVKGFLRSYAEYLGLDGQLYVDEYNSRYVTTGEEDAPMRATRRVPAAKARRTERRESNIVLLALTAIGLVTALVIVAWRFGGVDEEPVRGLTTPQQQQQVTPAPQAAGTARLELRATKGDSYMVVRSGSSQGEGNVMYEGTLERTQKKLFDSRVLWIRLEKPENVLVKLNGNRVKLPKAVKAQGVFVTAKKVFAADAS